MTLVSGDYIRVTCNFDLGDGTQYQNVYSYTRDGETVVSDAVTLGFIETKMEALYDELVSEVKNDTVEQLCFVDQVAWVVDEWKVVANIGVFTPLFAPVASGDALPYQCAPYVTFKTTRPKSVGKKYLFPFDEATQANTILGAGAIASLVAYGVIALEDIALGGDAILIPGIMRTGVQQWLSFQVAVVSDLLGTQKRRKPGVGA